MSTFDDPNREAVGQEPIWTGAGDEEPPPDPPAKDAPAKEPKPKPEPGPTGDDE